MAEPGDVSEEPNSEKLNSINLDSLNMSAKPESEQTIDVNKSLTQSGVTVQEGMEFVNAIGSMFEDASKTTSNQNIIKFDESMSLQDLLLIEHSYSRPYSEKEILKQKSHKLSSEHKTLPESKKLRKIKHKDKKIKKLKNKLIEIDKKHRNKKKKKGKHIEDEYKNFIDNKDDYSNSNLFNNNSSSNITSDATNSDRPKIPELSPDNSKSMMLISNHKGKKESFEVPFNKDGKLFGTISKLTDVQPEVANKDVKSILDASEYIEKQASNLQEVENKSSDTPTSGRIQRVRKKPKRWDNDEVEVDFSGSLNKLNFDEKKVKSDEEKSDDTPSKKRKTKAQKSTLIDSKEENESSIEQSDVENDDENEDDDDSSFSSDDDPEKLWCICRKPYDDRFMIGCDACEEWFHGKCVNVTKVQGRKMEKLKQEWFCPSCSAELSKGVSREVLKKEAEIKRNKIEEEERARIAAKKAKKMINKKKEIESKRKNSLSKQQTDSIKSLESELEEEIFGSSDSSKNNHKPIEKNLKITKDTSRKSTKCESLKELEERKKLKKLIKASKKDLNEKKEKLMKTKEHKPLNLDLMIDQSEQNSSNLAMTSPVNNNVSFSQDDIGKITPMNKSKGDNTPKKKHKSDPIDQSVQDLFKAEPVLMRSLSTSSTSSISPSVSQPHRKSSSGSTESRRASTSASSLSLDLQISGSEISCPSGCGKSIKVSSNNAEQTQSIYCNTNCIQNHVTAMLKFLRSAKRLKEKNNPLLEQKPLKAVLINRLTGKILSGKEAIIEKDVLSFITKNQAYEIYKPTSIQKVNSNNNNNNNNSSSNSGSTKTTPTTPTKSNKVLSDTKKASQPTSSSSSSSSSSSKRELTPSVSEKPDVMNRRTFVRNNIKDIFNTRYKELCKNNDKLKKISSEEISILSKKIEEELFKIFKSTNQKYNVKARSLIFNLKDPKNSLYRKVLFGKITPEKLVNMSAEELASSELARWRENEKKTMIELIKRDAVDQANQIIVKKTHKGEEFITENDIISDLPTSDLNLTEKNVNKDLKSSDALFSPEEANANEMPSTTSNVDITNDSSILDVLDTTSQHKSHVFSNNCKKCVRKLEESKINEKDLAIQSSQHSPPTSLTGSTTKDKEVADSQTQRSQPKRVRVELESTNNFLKEVVKLSDKLLSENSSNSTNNDSSSNEDVAHVTNSTSPIEAIQPKVSEVVPVKSEVQGGKIIWKGTIVMQEVAKFTSCAYNISGNIADNLSQGISEQITVCGRITPEQVLDYISKLKSSKRTDIGIVKFMWSSKEERVGYDAFFNYLNVRGRYGVVGNVGKLFKDFYILPLSRNSDLPKTLLPIDGPGLEKKSNRPNLLLGILIRTKKIAPSQPSNTAITSTVSQSLTQSSEISTSACERSYTPPLSANLGNTPPPNEQDDGSYTPPHNSHSKRRIDVASVHETKSKISKYETVTNPYDPEDCKINIQQKMSSSYMNDLMEKVASSSNPVEMTSSVLSAIANSDNYALQKRLLDQLTEKVEDQRRQLEKQKRDAEEKIFSQTTTNDSSSLSNSLSSSILANSSNSLSLDNVFNNIKNIEIPDNLKDILKSVQEKTTQIEAQQARLRVVSGNMNSLNDTPAISTNCDSKTYATKTAINDPRLRSKKPINKSLQSPPQSTEQISSIHSMPSISHPVASMSQDELLRKAQEQMAALAQMEHSSPTAGPAVAPNSKNNKEPVIVVGVPPYAVGSSFREHLTPASNSSNASLPKISFQWKKKK